MYFPISTLWSGYYKREPELHSSSVDRDYMRAAAEYICCQRQQTFKITVNVTFISIEFSSWVKVD